MKREVKDHFNEYPTKPIANDLPVAGRKIRGKEVGFVSVEYSWLNSSLSCGSIQLGYLTMLSLSGIRRAVRLKGPDSRCLGKLPKYLS